jgi:hypothetical protein
MLAVLLSIPAALLIGNAIAADAAYFGGNTAPAQILPSE